MDIPKSKFNSFLYSKLFIVIAVFFTVTVTLVVYSQMRKEEQRSFELKVDNAINNYSSLFSLKISSYTNELNNILRFYNSTNNVSYDAFSSFVAPVFEHNNDIQALEWIPKIAYEKLNQHQTDFRKVKEDYLVWQHDSNNKKQFVSKRDYYYPVMYIYPFEKNKSVLGFDLASNLKRLQALNSARDSGVSVATESITLVQQKNSEQKSFLIFTPFYKEGKHKVNSEQIARWTIAQRRENLAGFMLGVFNIGLMFESAIEFLPSSGLDVSIIDVTNEENKTLLYQHWSRLRTDISVEQDIGNYDEHFIELITREFRISGRQWNLFFVPTIHFNNQFQHNDAVIILSVGMLMSLLLLLYLLTLRYRMLVINKQINQYHTELVNSEIKQRAVIETIADALIVINDKGIIEAFNPAATNLFGYESSEVIGENVKILMTKQVQIEHDNYLLKFIQTGEKNVIGSSREVTGKRKNGSTFQLKLAVKEMLIQGELKFTGVMHDITRQKDFENEIIIAKELAEAGIESKNNFLATMSHEIRTPMNGVLGMIQILRDTKLSNEQREYVDVISNSGKALLGIINDILDFSKIEAGQLKIDPVDFDLEQIIFDVIQLLATKEKQKNIHFIFYYSLECPKFVFGDPDRIRQVLMNLIGNATKFTKQGHIYVLVKQIHKVNSICTLRIEVQDTGIGIPDKALPKLFDSFTQADSSTTRQYGGTGLGLAISKQLVNLMEGDIGVESDAGVGTTFWFTLALRASDKNEHFNIEIIENTRILIVDGYRFSRTQLETQLSGFGVKVNSVGSCQDAIVELLKCNIGEINTMNSYDAIITDDKIGTTSALAFIEQIELNKTLKDIDIILLSSVFKIGNTEKYHNAGASAYLSKPLLNSTLYRVLVEIGEHNRQKQNSIITQHSLQTKSSNTITPKMQLSASILIAEDNTVNTTVIKALLDKMGVSYSSVEDGKQCIAAWQELKFDLILMDCQMPVMDGYLATAEIRRSEKQKAVKAIPIIALTANVMAGDREKCLAAGMDDFLAKPIEYTSLEAMLLKWLSRNKKTVAREININNEINNEQQAYIDTQKIEQLTELMGDAMNELIHSYLASSEDKLLKMKQALDAMDCNELHQLAHSLKGASGNLGASKVLELSNNIEQLAKQKELQLIGEMLNELVMVFKVSRKQLLLIAGE